jgi:hypothetical protein
LQPKKQTSANRRHRLESPLQLPGTTVVREPPSAHKREQGIAATAATPNQEPAEPGRGAPDPPLPLPLPTSGDHRRRAFKDVGHR